MLLEPCEELCRGTLVPDLRHRDTGTAGVIVAFSSHNRKHTKNGLKQRHLFLSQSRKFRGWQSRRAAEALWWHLNLRLPLSPCSMILSGWHPSSCFQGGCHTSRHCICFWCRDDGKGANGQEPHAHTFSTGVLYCFLGGKLFPLPRPLETLQIVGRNSHVATLTANKPGNVVYIKSIFTYLIRAGGHSEKVVEERKNRARCSLQGFVKPVSSPLSI